jgi:hypothetical protein
MDTSRTLILRVIVHLRHAHAHPGIDPAVAVVLAAELRRLEHVIERLDDHHADMDTLIDAAIRERARMRGRLEQAEATLQRVMQVLGPDAPTALECRGCAHEIGEALAALRAFGVTYQPRTPEPDGE